jgi:hypothetical protein
MLERLLAHSRGRPIDEAKARSYVRDQATAAFREALGEFDAFVPHVRRVAEPAVHLGTARDSAGTTVPLRLAHEELAAHALIQGATGSGKTSFATWLLAEALRVGFPTGTIDCKTGFHDEAIARAAAHAYRLSPDARAAFRQRLVVINPFSPALVPLNVCRVMPGETVETQAYNVALVLSRLYGDMGFQMENALRHLMILLIESDLTLAEAPAILQDELLRAALVQRCSNPAVKEYFLRTYPGVPGSSKEALLTRLQALLLPEALRLMLGADECLDFRGIFERGDPCFLFLGMGPGIPPELVELLGTLLLQFLFAGATARGAKGQRRPYLVFADEFFHLVDVPVLAKRFERGLDSLRGFGLHLALVMHQFSQVPGSLREAILQQCDLVAIFRTSARNAQFFGEFLPESDPELLTETLRRTKRPPAGHEVRMRMLERLQRLPDRHCYLYDRRRPYRAVLARVPDVPAPHQAAGVSEAALERFIEAEGFGNGGAALPRAELCRQIEARRSRLRELLQPPLSVVRRTVEVLAGRPQLG